MEMESKNKEKLIFLGICFLLVLVIYIQTLGGNFVFDDRGIVDHQYFLSNARNFFKILSLPYWTQEAGLYRPVTLISYTFNFIFLGHQPWGFHLVNLVLYALTGYVVFLLIKRIFKQIGLAYLTALLFLVLPIHTEVAANIVGRAEILALLFSLLALYELINDKKRVFRIGFWSLLAIGSKETAIAILPLVWLIIAIKEKKLLPVDRKTWQHYKGKLLSILGAVLTYLGLRFLVLGPHYFLGLDTSIVENPLKFVSIGPRIFTALKITTMYAQKIFLPINLCSDYSYNQISALNNFYNLQSIIGLMILLFFATGIFVFFRRAPFLSLASGFFLFSFLPVSNLIFPIGTIAGERLIYFPSLGICMYLAAAFLWLIKLKNKKFFLILSIILFFILMGFYATISFKRSKDWLTEKRLFISAAKCAPNSVLSRSNLGAIYYLEGNYAAAKKELLFAEKIYDKYSKGVNNLGLVYWKEGQREKARQYFLRALNLKFPYYGAYENLALMALEEGKFDEAKNWLTKLYPEEIAELYIKSFLQQQKISK